MYCLLMSYMTVIFYLVFLDMFQTKIIFSFLKITFYITVNKISGLFVKQNDTSEESLLESKRLRTFLLTHQSKNLEHNMQNH